MKRPLPQRLAALLVAAALAAGCRSNPYEKVPARYTVEEVPAVVQAVEADLSAGAPADEAVLTLLSAKKTVGLSAQGRRDVQRALERAAARLVDESQDPRELRNLMVVDLPRRIAVEAGIRAARIYYEERNKRMKAFRTVREVDGKFPQHHLRQEAGSLLARVGFDLAEDRRRYGLFFHYRGLAPQVLEYLVLNYPSDPSGDRALWTLGEIYEEKRNWSQGIEKHEDLILWFPDSEYAPRSAARIPHLRLASLGSPEHDRRELVTARGELERWLGAHPGHPLEEDVRRDLTDCVQRLADNDLIVARFYRTVKNFEGAEYHARRAVDEARDGGDQDQIEEAEQLLEAVVAWGGGKRGGKGT